jgi:hypothetical protein
MNMKPNFISKNVYTTKTADAEEELAGDTINPDDYEDRKLEETRQCKTEAYKDKYYEDTVRTLVSSTTEGFNKLKITKLKDATQR